MKRAAMILSVLLSGCYADVDLPRTVALECGGYGEVDVSMDGRIRYEDGGKPELVDRDVDYYGVMKSVESEYSDGSVFTSAEMGSGSTSFSLERDGNGRIANCYLIRHQS